MNFILDHRRGNDFSILARYDTSEIEPLENKEIEYFFASDASAVIEHTNQVIFLEVGRNFGAVKYRVRQINAHYYNSFRLQDDDVAAVKDGLLSIHRLKRSLDDSHAREIITLKMEIQEIMKGIKNSRPPPFCKINEFSYFSQICVEQEISILSCKKKFSNKRNL